MTDSPAQRILHALNLESHLTGKQLARLLYPKDYANDVKNKAYQRVMKNLKTLQQRDKLLKSKSYGLGRDMLWSLTSHKINKELGYKAKPDVHAFKYDHEKDCADIFVSLALTGTLLEWQGEGDQKTGFRHDRMFSVDDRIFYLEVERGTQGDGKLRAKLERYIKHY